MLEGESSIVEDVVDRGNEPSWPVHVMLCVAFCGLKRFVMRPRPTLISIILCC